MSLNVFLVKGSLLTSNIQYIGEINEEFINHWTGYWHIKKEI